MKYSLKEIIYLLSCKLLTLIFYKNARLIRYPIDIRGKKNIDFGNMLTTGKYCRIETYTKNKKIISLRFGSNVQINDFVHITASNSIVIGNNVLIASKVYISDSVHGSYKGDIYDSFPDSKPIERESFYSPVVIEDNVWIGEMVSILPGVRVGKGSIIGANSVVAKSVPENCIAVGNPAKVVKKFNMISKHWEKV